MFRNKQCTREEYLEKLKNIDFSSYAVREELQREFKELMEKGSIHRYVVSERNTNAIGSLVYDCRNVRDSFEVNKCEDVKYVYGGIENKFCMDIYHVGYNVELCYELQGCTRVANCQFCHLCYDNVGVMYSDSCQNSQNLFGCVSVKKGEYMIFNKKYSKEQFLELKEKIIEHMRKTGEYGEFFPPLIAPVYYNETQGNLYMPLSKEEVLSRGWHWEDKVPGTFGKETVRTSEIPDRIEDVSEDALKAVYACMICSKNYNITSDEFTFYRREKIPLPRKCPECRYHRRFVMRPLRKLWHRTCMCMKQNHGHTETCTNEFETAYAPERPEIIYCESCYTKEIL